MECKKFDDDDWETIQETGVITCFDRTTCKAIIDRKYLFYTNKFSSANCNIECGTKVWFTAQRSERNPQWQLTSLEIYESNQEGLKQKMGKGKTTLPSILQNASQNDGVLNSNRADDDDDDDWMVDDLDEHIISAHKALLKNKSKIKITPKVIRFPSLTTGASAKIIIKIHNDSEHLIRLKQISFIRDPCISNFEFNLADKVNTDGCILLLPNSEMPLELTCQAMLIGKTTELCIFDFGSFQIGRMVIVMSKSEVEKEIESSFVERADTAGKSAVEVSQIIKDHARTPIKSSHRVRSSFFLQKPLPAYEITPEMWRFLEFKDEKILLQCYPKALDVLQYDIYKEKFKVFLWIEEMECHRMRRQYDMKDVILTKCQNAYYTFKAPGIQDIQPPVNISDTLDVFNPANPSDYRYEGIIKDLSKNKVTCVFGSLFDAQYTGCPLTVQFRLGRNIYRRCHFAVETAVELLGKSFLFPEPEFQVKNPRIVVMEDELGQNENSVDLQQQEIKAVAPAQSIFSATVLTHQKSMARFMSSPAYSENCGKRLNNLYSHRSVSATVSEPSSNNFRLRWFNNQLNEEQRNAVRRILRGQARPLPYIIYGPPGTGKTVTLVEAIMQVNKLDKNSRILVCAPSNSAADIVAEYLANSNIYHPGDFLRLNGFLRSRQTIPESVAPFCVDGEDLGNVVKHRLIISTCSTAGQFFNLDLSDGHFTHVFVDEAGYCTEPQTMIAAVLLSLTKDGQLILAGDPNQLGAVLMSPVARKGRLNMSFLERLMTRRLYRRDVKRFPEEKYNPLVLTMLVRNYRSHPTLLKLPSQLFYDADLLPAASYKETHELCQLPNLKELLVLGVPLLFHGVHGTCSRERGSTSSFNIAEACQVAQYVIGLMNDGGLKSEDIGIITPYRKQVEKIRHTLEGVLTANVEIPKVASVEEFQGGERKVIIISTVRSYNEDQVDKHLEHLSFVYDPKRYNVATTRAKALMIVVGNPHLLSHNSYWFKLLKYCIELKAYKGCNLPINLCPDIRKFVVEKEREEIEGAVSTQIGRQFETNSAEANAADQIDSFRDLILDDPEPDDTW